jgi:hypothetical protein
MRIPSVVLIIAAMSVLTLNTGCSILKSAGSGASDVAAVNQKNPGLVALKGEKLIAADLVYALAQIPKLRPDVTELHVVEPVSNFELFLQEALFGAGYKLSSHSSDSGRPTVISTVTLNRQLDTDGSTSTRRTYQIDIADVKIKRDYFFERDAVVPEPEMYFKGVDTIRIQLDDGIFQTVNSNPTVDTNLHQVHNSPTNGLIEKTTGRAELPPADAGGSSDAESSSPALKLSLIAPSDQGRFSEGDLINLKVESTVDTQIFCYYQDGLGNVARLFPNRYQSNNRLRAGQTLQLPDSDEWHLTATRSGASDSFLCIASANDLSEQYLPLSNQPDLQTLPVKDLQQIYDDFSSAAGSELTNRTISLAVQ